MLGPLLPSSQANWWKEERKRRKGYLKEAGVALQLRGAEGPRRTEAGPQMDVGDERAGRQQEARRSLRVRTPMADEQRVDAAFKNRREVPFSSSGTPLSFLHPFNMRPQRLNFDGERAASRPQPKLGNTAKFFSDFFYLFHLKKNE